MSFEPDLDAFTFTGTTVIEFNVNSDKLKEGKNASEIILHAKELCFVSAEYRVMGSEAKPTKASEINLNLTAHTVTFVFPDAIPDTAQTIVLSIEYSGFLNNQMAGFYRSSYKDINGNTKIMASTQFESLDARRAFPCIDEPGVKSVFGLTLTIPSDRLCFSNMPEDSVVSLSATKKRVKFRWMRFELALSIGK